ncbi:hypothetical protein [Serinicoccus sp. CNJ-927]|uniref:hypothetical protein n=1 Tax=Serinicoccus sp. CNJ-927 TaxID=1904970 RepID=UPI001EDB1A6A|nr:hypothetical protein [Serinicoccus sp. CNJ-927]
MLYMTLDLWAPDHVRRQVMRQARYALNVAVLDEDRVPPEGPFDVALTNGLLAIIAAIDPVAVVDRRGLTLPASALLPRASALGLSIDQETLANGLQLTQPLRHGRADDEWIQLESKHVTALRALDEMDGLGVLHHVAAHRTVDDMMVTLFSEKAEAYAERDVRRVKDLLDVMEPEECDDCFRRTFVPLGYDDSGGTMAVGLCIACGYQRDEDTARDMYLTEQWELKWQHE